MAENIPEIYTQFPHSEMVRMQKVIKAALNPRVEYSETPSEMSREAYAIRGNALEFISRIINEVGHIPLQ